MPTYRYTVMRAVSTMPGKAFRIVIQCGFTGEASLTHNQRPFVHGWRVDIELRKKISTYSCVVLLFFLYCLLLNPQW